MAPVLAAPRPPRRQWAWEADARKSRFLQPHFCVQYEVLEAAQLAIESLDGTVVEDTCIKVGWPGDARAAPVAQRRPASPGA